MTTSRPAPPITPPSARRRGARPAQIRAAGRGDGTGPPRAATEAGGPPLPAPRGWLSRTVLDRLRGEPGELPAIHLSPVDPLADEDVHLTLYVLYELHYRGFAGVDPRWEWNPALLGLRGRLEACMEAALRRALADRVDTGERTDDLLRRRVREDRSPSLSSWLDAGGDLRHLRELAVHRSAYQLKEADPHSWAIPRLHGGPKAALVEIQADEYGGGDPHAMHSALFARTMAALGLADAYGAHLDRIPGYTLATVNLMSLFGLHRRLRGALVGHLAVFEMTSSEPNRRYARVARRLGVPDEGCRFFDEHVEADAVHEAIAAYDLATGLVEQEPSLRADVIFGADALMLMDARAAAAMIAAWEAGRSSLRGVCSLR